jgi:iron complex outermembrane receptor protein
VRWTGRTLERISVFGELQAPLIPAAKLPHPLKAVELDLAARYTLSTQSNETNLAPTVGLKVDFSGGFAFRGSYTTSNRFPTPKMSRPLAEGSGGGSPSEPAQIFDPVRGELYEIETRTVIDPSIKAEAAATQTAGLIWQHGKTHRLRASLDFADTTKTNEIIAPPAQAFVNNEDLFADRVLRTTPPPVPPPTPNRITTVFTGTINAARRHSQNWSAALDYSWTGVLGGTLELRGRWVWYQRYDRQVFANSAVVDELEEPDGFSPGLLRHRLSFGTSWTNRIWGIGVDTHYLSERQLPKQEWPAQGSDHIEPYWQLDAFAQIELTRWLPRPSDKFRLTAQLRVNNLSNFAFPKYVNDASGAGVQPYGDWRGRTYSLSLTAEF